MSPINSSISHSFATATTFPKIVTNGLVFNYDAGQQNSYIGIGTIWKDLSGNARDGTLTNGPTFSSANGGSLLFDKSNDYVQVSGTITVTAATFLAFIKKSNVLLNDFNAIIFSRGNSGNTTGMNTAESNVVNEKSGLSYHWNESSGGSANTFGDLRMLDTNDPWRMAAVTFTSTAATGYLTSATGILQSQTINGTFNSSSLNNIQIGGDTAQSRYFGGNIAAAMMYNRALSAQEIRQNFDSLRGRFGI